MDSTLSVIKAISDKNRLRIFCALLVHDELCACQITEFLQVAGATASRHLSQMVNAGVLQNRKQGRWIYFRISSEDPSLSPLFKWVKGKLENSRQIQKDLASLEEILRIPCEDLSRKQRRSGTCTKS
ncbi:MAG: metalloregulator ArsR/SmtB family transcription factor [Desulfobacterales bacterium]|nr:metalloregulator ArsR/SmtB family transcription factor [Desulfobacterales bacterium]